MVLFSGAIDDAKLGNLTGLVEQIKPVVAKDKDLDTTAKHNVELTAKHILERSPVIQQLVNEGKVKNCFPHFMTWKQEK